MIVICKAISPMEDLQFNIDKNPDKNGEHFCRNIV